MKASFVLGGLSRVLNAIAVILNSHSLPERLHDGGPEYVNTLCVGDRYAMERVFHIVWSESA